MSSEGGEQDGNNWETAFTVPCKSDPGAAAPNELGHRNSVPSHPRIMEGVSIRIWGE